MLLVLGLLACDDDPTTIEVLPPQGSTVPPHPTEDCHAVDIAGAPFDCDHLDRCGV